MGPGDSIDAANFAVNKKVVLLTNIFCAGLRSRKGGGIVTSIVDDLITVRDLHTQLVTHRGVVDAVEGVSFAVGAQKSLGIVGESGCGKTQTALAIMGLLPRREGRIVAGDILYRRGDTTVNLVRVEPNGREYRQIRGREIAMVFQEPMTSLNPAFTIGSQIIEAVRAHQRVTKRDAKEIAIAYLDQVRIPAPHERFYEYPHQLSGGMRQRAMIAMALSSGPRLVIADEPTSALDVTIQAQILDLIKELQLRNRTSLMMITHNLGVVAETADNVVVMYRGRSVEQAPTREIFRSPLHPYTQGLLNSMPSIARKQARLVPIPGSVPGPFVKIAGCPFKERCSYAMKICDTAPPVVEVAGDHSVACWLHVETSGESSG